MDLYELAMTYKKQFLDNYYLLKTDSSEVIIHAKPFNFLHLTGLQRCPALPRYDRKEDFYYDCLQHKYPDSGRLINSINNKGKKISQI
ncbi:MAG: PBECR4 domain-containing protein [Oscillospiraceae bacterium]